MVRMIEAERAVTELRRLIEEQRRQINYERRVTQPNDFKIRTLERNMGRFQTKLNLLQGLIKEVKELESTVSFKMMTRYPENQPYRAEYKRDLTRTRRQLKELAAQYQPKEKPKRPAYLAAR